MTHSLAQKEASALTLLRNALSQGWSSETLMVDFATAALGEEHRPLVQKVWDKHFRTMEPI